MTEILFNISMFTIASPVSTNIFLVNLLSLLITLLILGQSISQIFLSSYLANLYKVFECFVTTVQLFRKIVFPSLNNCTIYCITMEVISGLRPIGAFIFLKLNKSTTITIYVVLKYCYKLWQQITHIKTRTKMRINMSANLSFFVLILTASTVNFNVECLCGATDTLSATWW